MANYIGYGRTMPPYFKVTDEKAFDEFCEKFNVEKFTFPTANDEIRYGFTCYNTENGEPDWIDDEGNEEYWQDNIEKWLHPEDCIIFMHHGSEKDKYHVAYCVGLKVGYPLQFIQLPDDMQYRMDNIDEFADKKEES